MVFASARPTLIVFLILPGLRSAAIIRINKIRGLTKSDHVNIDNLAGYFFAAKRRAIIRQASANQNHSLFYKMELVGYSATIVSVIFSTCRNADAVASVVKTP